jgi:hypothetical protein
MSAGLLARFLNEELGTKELEDGNTGNNGNENA